MNKCAGRLGDHMHVGESETVFLVSVDVEHLSEKDVREGSFDELCRSL